MCTNVCAHVIISTNLKKEVFFSKMDVRGFGPETPLQQKVTSSVAVAVFSRYSTRHPRPFVRLYTEPENNVNGNVTLTSATVSRIATSFSSGFSEEKDGNPAEQR